MFFRRFDIEINCISILSASAGAQPGDAADEPRSVKEPVHIVGNAY
jgi:hypothetical protein